MARYALIIGIQSYYSSPLPSLSNAARDAEDMAVVLEQHGNFQTVKRLPEQWLATKESYRIHPKQPLAGDELGRSLREFLLIQAHKQDALIYFSGHGISVASSLGVKRGYLAASDCQVEVDGNGNIKDQRYGISLDDLNALIQQSDLSSLVVILDCCHSGYLIDRALTEQSLSAFRNKQDYCLITASRSFEQAWEGKDHSVLTEAILQGLSRENANPETGRVSGDRLFDFVYTRLQNSGQEPFRTGVGRSITLVTYPIQPQEAEPEASEAIAEIDESIIPYRGLEPFEAEQAAFFFGRRQVVESIWNLLDQHKFVAVIGASGSGKSSTVRAGLVPWLQYADWKILEPVKPGITPLAELMAVFKPYFSGTRELKRLDELVSTPPDGLRQIANHLKHTPLSPLLPRGETETETPSPSKGEGWGGVNHLLVIDQFEELFTVSRATERDRLIHLLTDLAQNPHPHLSVVITLRADFLEPCLAYPELTKLIQHQAIFMPPLVGADLERAIAQPAQKQGYSLEIGLLGAILHDLGQETGSLPLLQFALLELWERRDRTQHQLTRNAYTEMGGVMGALNDHAERIYEALEPSEQEWAKRICLKLVRTGVGDRDTRQRQPKSALLALATEEGDRNALEHTLDTLVEGRLLVTGTDQNIAVIDLSHEALTEGWKRFSEWREEDRELRRLGDRIEDAYREWERSGRSNIYLLPKSLTTQAKTCGDELQQCLSQELWDYVQLSYSYEEQQLQELEWAKSEAVLIARLNDAMNALSQNPVESMFQVIRLTKWAMAIEKTSLGAVQNALCQVLEKGRECNQIDGHRARLLDVAFSPDGEMIASSGEDSAIRLWDLQGNPAGDVFGQFIGGAYVSLAFHPDQPLLLASCLGEISIWNYQENWIANRISYDPLVTAQTIAISLDGTLLVGGRQDGLIDLFTADGQWMANLEAQNSVWSVCFHPDGQTIAAGLGNSMNHPDAETIATKWSAHNICLWNIKGQLIGQPLQGHQEKVTSVCFSPDGTRLVSGSNDYTVRLWDLEGNELCQYNEHGDEVKSVAFSPDGRVIASSSRDRDIILRTLDGEPAMEPLRGHTSSVRAIAFHPTRPLLVSGSHDDTVRLWNIESRQIGQPLQAHQDVVSAIAFSPDNSLIVSGSLSGKIHLWQQGETPESQMLNAHEEAIYTVAFSPDGTQFATAGDDHIIHLWSPDGSLLTSLDDHTSQVRVIAFSPDGQTIASGDQDGMIFMWTAAGKIITRFRAHASGVLTVAFSPDGKILASGSENGSITLWGAGVWSTKTAKTVRQIHAGSASSLVFSPDSSLIACGCSNGNIFLWNWTDDTSRWIQGHTAALSSVAFSPDGSILISSSYDNTLRLWNTDGTAIGDPINVPFLTAMALAADGQTIATGSSDGTLRLWKGGMWQDWLRECCDRLRYHPVFKNPPDDTAREACEFCREWCGW